MRLSSKLTTFSKILILLLGIPISCVIAVQTDYAVWGVGLSILLVCCCVFFALKTADLYKNNDVFVFKKFGASDTLVLFNEINKVKIFHSNKNTYLWFDTTKGSFLVIAPMWGDSKLALIDIYSQYKTQAL